MYISEVAPAQMRGRLVSVNQLTIVIGVLTAQIINWWLVNDLPAGATSDFIVNSWYGQQGWRWMFAITAAPSLLFLFGLVVVPESPRWLIKKAQVENARRILTRIGGSAYAATCALHRLARSALAQGPRAGSRPCGVSIIMRN